MEKESKSYKTSLIYRKKWEGGFSIEKIFNHIAILLKQSIRIEEIYLPQNKVLPWTIWKNFRSVRKVTADIFHITGDIHYMVMAFPALSTILTIHDCVFLHNTKGIKRWILKLFFLKWPVRYCHTITTISEKSRNEIIQHSGCSPDKVIVIPNPVGTLFYYLPKIFNESRPVLLFIGSTPNKNLERVIDALESIPCHLLIVGKINPQQSALMQKANISFQQLYGLSEQELADTYAQCDIVIFPSTYEGFGLPIIEGQKSGRPVITSNISPMKEVAGEGACLVDPFHPTSIKEGIQKIIQDKAYRETIVQKGFENVRSYEATVITERYLEVYKAVLSSANIKE